MARSRRSPPRPRTPEEREAAFRERQARARPGRCGRPAARPGRRHAAGAAARRCRPPPRRRRPRGRSRVARNTAIFSVATGLSRVAGPGARDRRRAATSARPARPRRSRSPSRSRTWSARWSPTRRSSSAFVPVFSELLEHKRRREAIQLASALAGLILVVLGALTLVFIAVAPWLMPLFTGDTFTPALDDLTVGLSRVLFPIVVLLGLNGLVVGILNAYDHFTIPALAPLVWNLVIIAGLVVLTPLFEGDDRLYAYAIGVVAGTAVQLADVPAAAAPARLPAAHLASTSATRGSSRCCMLMLPVSVGLGLINIDVLLNSVIGSLVSDEAPSAIDAAFRIYMLPQGMFSVAVATVLFPALARLASRRDLAGLRRATGTGMRQIALLLIPSAAATIALATPIVRLRLPARRVRRRVDPADRRGAVLVRLLAAVLGHQPAAHADVLRAPAAVAADRARARVAAWSTSRSRSRCTGRWGSAGVVLGTTVGERRDDGAAHAPPAARARRPGGRRARCARRRSCSPRPRCSAASPTGPGTALDELLGRSLLAQIVSRRRRRSRWAAPSYAAVVLRCGCRRRARSVDLFRAPAAARRLVTCSAAHGRPVPHPQLLDHRPHRPWQVDAGRPHPGDDAHRRPARDARPAARLDGPRARARDHDQGAGRARLLHGARRRDLPAPPDRHARATSTSPTRSRARWPRARARCSWSTPPRASRPRPSPTPTWRSTAGWS